MSRLLVIIFIAAAGGLMVFPGGAEGKSKRSRRGKKSRIVSVDFDDELRVKGRLMGPSIFSLFQKKELNYGKLIKPREDFLPEMRRTLDDIR